METKTIAEYVDLGFGFPVVLREVPMVKVRGRWTPHIKYESLAKEVLVTLARLPERLSGNHIRFIRQYFEMTLQQFAERLGVTHVAVLKWERCGEESTGMNWSTEKDIRLLINHKLVGRPKEFLALYAQLEGTASRQAGIVTLDAHGLAA